jgi:hypothetical protein
MKPSAYATVYLDPVTRQKPEGKALLVGRNSFVGFCDGLQLENWNVRFIEGGRLGEVVERTIAKPEVAPTRPDVVTRCPFGDYEGSRVVCAGESCTFVCILRALEGIEVANEAR